jgi:hypothetical protein
MKKDRWVLPTYLYKVISYIGSFRDSKLSHVPIPHHPKSPLSCETTVKPNYIKSVVSFVMMNDVKNIFDK